MSETILGLDISSVATGYCVEKDEKFIDYGVIHPDNSLTQVEKLWYIYHEVHALIKKHDVDELIIEDIYLKFFNAFKILCRLQGAMIALWFSMKFRPLIIIPTVSARKAIGAPVRGKKKDVMKHVNKLVGLGIKDDNVADAFVLILAYKKQLEKPEIEIPTETKKTGRKKK